MTDRIMNETSYGTAALAKLGTVPENFIIYSAGWMETGGGPETWDTMKVTGAEFRAAKTGKNKGKLCVPIKGTQRTVYVSEAEMREQDATQPR